MAGAGAGEKSYEIGKVASEPVYLSPAGSSSSIDRKPECFGIPGQNDFFSGRTKELGILADVFSDPKNNIACIGQRPIFKAVAGAGGFGKSQLAIRYTREMGLHYNCIVWVDCQQSSSSLTISLQNLVQWLTGQDELDISQAQKLKSILLDNFIRKGYLKVLFIWDDVANYRMVETFLLKNTKGVIIHNLITSRHQDWGSVPIVSLGELEPEDAIAFISSVLAEFKIMESEDDIKLLAKTLHYYPLALNQAVAWICKNKQSISEYLVRFDKDRAKRKMLLASPVFKDDVYKQTVLTTHDITFAQLLAEYGEDCSWLLLLSTSALLAST